MPICKNGRCGIGIQRRKLTGIISPKPSSGPGVISMARKKSFDKRVMKKSHAEKERK